MDNNFKILLGTVIATIVIIVIAVFAFSGQAPTADTSTPVDPSILIRNSGYNAKGASTPAVTIVKFSDFQCPGCKAAAPALQAIVTKYPEQVQVIYRHFPLPQHPLARPAAAAAEAAGKQSKFWEMHDLIFQNQESLTADSFSQYAQQLGLNLDQFNTDRTSQAATDIVQGDYVVANQLQINQTPTIFINGIMFNLPVTIDNLSTVIEQQLAMQLLQPAEGTSTQSGDLNPTTSTDSATASPAAERQ